MPVRFEINSGILQVIQTFDFPAVYLDHWALRLFSSDQELRQRFLRALKASGGSLVVSHVNLAEITGPSDPRHAGETAAFFEATLPNIYFAMFDIQKAIDQECHPRDTQIRLPAPPDIELLRAVAMERSDDFRPFTIAGLINLVAANRQRLGAEWLESNQELADHINRVRSNPKTIEQARNFTSHPSHIPTLAVLQELLRPLFLDKSLKVDRNDAGDIHHAITSIVYCDYALLDGKWEDLHERMMRCFKDLGLSMRVAKVFSKRRQGVELFLKEIEGRSSTVLIPT